MIKAIFSFGFLQALNFLTPIIAIALVSRSESNDALSTYLLMQSISTFLAVVVEYGFYLSGVRRVSVAKRSGDLGVACSLVNTSKFLIFCLIALLLLLDALFSARYEMQVYIGALLAVFVIGMRPLWYFQGSENYKKIIACESIAGILTLALIIAALGRNFSGSTLFSISFVPKLFVVLYLIKYIHDKEGFVKVGIIPIFNFLKESFFLFLHKVASGVLHYTVPIILGIFFSTVDLISYQRADRVFYLFQSVSLIFSQVIFSKLMNMSEKTKKANFSAIAVQLVISLSFAVVLYSFPLELLYWYYGESSSESAMILEHFALIMPLMGINAAIGLTFFVVNNNDHVLVITAVMGAVATLLLLWIKPFGLGLVVGVYSILSGELVILLGMLFYLINRKS